MTMFIDSNYQRKTVSKAVKPRDARFSIFDRQEKIVGFDQRNLSNAKALLIGAGGIGSEVGEGLCRKGIGAITFVEHDVVEDTNLNRQFFFRRDLGKPKAWRIIRNLKKHCTNKTALTGLNLRFQDALALGLNFADATFFVCGVDNGETRVAVSNHFRALGIPGIFIAVSLEAEAGYVFVHESNRNAACFGCLFHKNPFGRPAPCKAPACKDILKVTAGVALYAVDSLLMNRKRNWNYRCMHLAGFMPDASQIIERHAECPLCKHE